MYLSGIGDHAIERGLHQGSLPGQRALKGRDPVRAFDRQPGVGPNGREHRKLLVVGTEAGAGFVNRDDPGADDLRHVRRLRSGQGRAGRP